MREPGVLEDVSRLVNHPGWYSLREEAEKKLTANEDTINRLIFRTRTPVDPVEVEYFRGFRQGVMYVLDGLPNEILTELQKLKDQIKKESGRS